MGRRGMHIGYWLESQKERDQQEDTDVGERMYLRETGCGEMDWMHLAQDRDQWRAHVNTVTFGLHKMLGSSKVATKLTASQEGLSSMKLVYPNINTSSLHENLSDQHQ
jgi:hypothetical protein